MSGFSELLRQALAEGQPFALGIIARSTGSSPQKQGAKALFFADGRIKGTLGGGCLEAEIQDRARRALVTKEAGAFELVLDHDFGWDDGLICGGKVWGLILPRAAEAQEVWQKVLDSDRAIRWGVKEDFTIALMESEAGRGWRYRENPAPRCALWIAGSGHVAQAVAPIALQLDFDVTVFDDRPLLANREHFPTGTRLRVGAWDRLLHDAVPDRPTFGLILTRGHQHDALVLKEWVRRPFVFLGMIGSQRKRRIIFDQFLQQNIATEEQLERVACPVGTDIGAVTVAEIAISIAGQLVQQRGGMRETRD